MTPVERQGIVQRLKELREAIVAKKLDFASAAKQVSQEANAPQGGVIGFIPRKFAVEEAFAQTAFALKPGEISEPVVTDFGVHLIVVNERRQGPGSTFEKAKPEAKEFYLEEMFQGVLAQQRKIARIEVLLK
jgi:parvulin-like peptidyl-prolyl isomerase